MDLNLSLAHGRRVALQCLARIAIGAEEPGDRWLFFLKSRAQFAVGELCVMQSSRLLIRWHRATVSKYNRTDFHHLQRWEA